MKSTNYNISRGRIIDIVQMRQYIAETSAKVMGHGAPSQPKLQLQCTVSFFMDMGVCALSQGLKISKEPLRGRGCAARTTRTRALRPESKKTGLITPFWAFFGRFQTQNAVVSAHVGISFATLEHLGPILERSRQKCGRGHRLVVWILCENRKNRRLPSLTRPRHRPSIFPTKSLSCR